MLLGMEFGLALIAFSALSSMPSLDFDQGKMPECFAGEWNFIFCAIPSRL